MLATGELRLRVLVPRLARDAVNRWYGAAGRLVPWRAGLGA